MVRKSFLDKTDKEIIITGEGHLLGRLASIVAKQLLCGQSVVVLSCEKIMISGGLVRQKMKFKRFLRKRMATQPSHGPIHYRAPSKIFWRTVRGMVPHKTSRGADAMGRLRVFEGIPKEYWCRKRLYVPSVYKLARLRFNVKSCVLGDLSEKVGWKYRKNVEELEEKRKARMAEIHEKK